MEFPQARIGVRRSLHNFDGFFERLVLEDGHGQASLHDLSNAFGGHAQGKGIGSFHLDIKCYRRCKVRIDKGARKQGI